MQTERDGIKALNRLEMGTRRNPRLTRKAIESLAGVCVNLRASKVAEFDSVGAVDLFAYCGDFFLNRESEIIQELEFRGGFTARNNRSSELAGSGSTFCPVIANNRSVSTTSDSHFLHKGEFGGGVRAWKGG